MIISGVAKGMKEVDQPTFIWFITNCKAKGVPAANGTLFHDLQARLVAQQLGKKFYVKVKLSSQTSA